MKLYTRWGEEWHYPNECIRPFDGMVVECFDAITMGIASPDEQAIACWDFVATEVDYPLTLLGESTDYHLPKAYPVSEGFCGISLPLSNHYRKARGNISSFCSVCRIQKEILLEHLVCKLRFCFWIGLPPFRAVALGKLRRVDGLGHSCCPSIPSAALLTRPHSS